MNRIRCGRPSRRTWVAPTGSRCICARTGATFRIRTSGGCASSCTSSSTWGKEARLKKVVAKLSEAGIVSSVFIDAEGRQVDAAARIGAKVCEIHTGPYAHAFHARGRDPRSVAVIAEIEKIRAAGAAVLAHGMRFNAGHALNYFNVQPIAALPSVRELHIGHAIVSRAVFVGLREAVREMKALLREAAGAALRPKDERGRT